VTARSQAPATATPTLDPVEREAGVLSMRILEFALALSALATAVLLGVWR
jgi:hypothetical protein